VIDVVSAESAQELDEVRRLFRAFVVWHHDRQGHNAGLVTSYFDEAEWEAELASLPGAYAATSGGALLLAGDNGTALGCVALRRLDAESCEMKRMFVDDAGRGRGVGRALGKAILQRARVLGYAVMYLDTSVEQHEAIGLYRSLGFEECEPFHDVPDAMRGWLVFFRLEL
jgi:putative acetyltransferase